LEVHPQESVLPSHLVYYAFGLPPGPQSANLVRGRTVQAEDDIGSVLFDGVEKLSLVKPNREDDFLASASPRQPTDNFLGNVILKLAVGAKAVDEEAH